MPIDVTCPECDKALRLRDEVAGKRIKCPGCGAKILAKAKSAEAEDDEMIAVSDDRPAKSKKKPKRRRDEDDEDDDEDDRPRRKKKKTSRDVPQVSTPIAPLVWGVLAVLMPFPIVGTAIGGIAIAKANMELGSLPAGKRGDTARRNMKIAVGLGAVGIILSIMIGVLLLVFGS